MLAQASYEHPDTVAAEWPDRSLLCLDCRHLRERNDPCPEEGHRSVDLGSAEGLRALNESRWDRSLDVLSATKRAKRVAVVAAVWAVCAALVYTMLHSDNGTVTLAAMVFVAVLGPASVLVAWSRLSIGSFRDAEQRPLGASAPPALLLSDSVCGVVVDGSPLPSPLGAEPCVAYGVWLHHGEARPSTLVAHDAANQALVVRTDSGEVLEIAAGSADVRGIPEGASTAGESGRELLRRLSLLGAQGQSLLDFDEARQLTIRVDDRVAVHGAMRRELDPRGEPSTYRDPPQARLVPVGPVALERIE